VVAHLAQVHQHVHDREEVAVVHRGLSAVHVDVLVVEVALAPRETALDDVLDLLGQLLLHVPLEPPQHERPQDVLQILNHVQVKTLVLVYALVAGILEPLLEI